LGREEPTLPSRPWIGAALLLFSLAAAGLVRRQSARATGEARRRISGRSALIATSYGALEYAVAGEGRPLLMVHGTGGGFDQGLLFGDRLSSRGHAVVAPSRFGYLASDFPADPSPAHQADAFAALLDHLGLDRILVVGGSAGALSAAAFALRHPDRCTGLVLLVPAANVAGRDPVEMRPLPRWAVERLLGSDTLFAAAVRAIPRRLIGTLLATDPALLDMVEPDERRRAFAILEGLMPIGAKRRGLLNDARLSGAPTDLDFARIAVPTLILSVEDDRFGTADTARRIAALLPQARLVIYPRGGHVWLGHDADVAAEIDAFVAGLSASAPIRPGAGRLTPSPVSDNG